MIFSPAHAIVPCQCGLFSAASTPSRGRMPTAL
jgi:hypothetical protein